VDIATTRPLIENFLNAARRTLTEDAPDNVGIVDLRNDVHADVFPGEQGKLR
jgi:hypothetical protein